jgi:hypothetical protein
MNSLIKYSAVALFAGLIAACGGGGSSSPVQASGPAPAVATKATVGIILTDASAEDYDHAYVTISSVELLGDGGNQLIFSGNKQIDLLALRDNVELFAVSENVEPGDYSKIRIQASDMELVVYNEDGTSTSTPANLVANGKIDLNPQGEFTLAAGDVVFVSLDWDMHESLKLTETGNGNGKINMRPVIFVDIGTVPAFKQGLVRVFGKVDLIASDMSAFRLCSPDVMTQIASNPVLGALCLDIVINEKTGLFGANGEPIDVADLGKGDPVTVVGLLRRSIDGPIVTPLQDESGDLKPTTFQVLAIVVEGGDKGTWSRMRGSVNSDAVAGVDPGTNVFDFLDDKAPDAVEDTVLTGKLFDTSRVFSLSRDNGVSEIAATELMIDDRAAVDSVQIPSGDASVADTLNIAIMLSRTPADPDLDHIRGEILTVDAANGTMMIASTSGGDAKVCTDDETKIFQIFVSDDVLESVPSTLDDLSAGSKVVISGLMLMDGCFAANLIVAEGQTATP